MNATTTVKGGVTAPRGYAAAGVHAGLKATKPDMALVVSDRPAAAAGTFTRNAVQAAPVRLCRERLRRGLARAVVFNSGNANACNGPQGLEDARRTARVAAEALGVDEQDVLVCSTGVIGVPLPMAKIEAGVRLAARSLAPDGGDAAARAIMTTDTVDKQVALELDTGEGTVRVGGMAKGAAMICPNMATMLALLTTDAEVPADALQACLGEAVAATFNRITVDGDQSTNDTALALANGASGVRLGPGHRAWPAFCAAVGSAAEHLARAIVRDAEGATKFVTVRVRGAASAQDAEKAARAVAGSLLVKTSWHGGDPNWGRVMAALGYCGCRLSEELVEIRYDDVIAFSGGRGAGPEATKAVAAVLARPAFTLGIDLRAGKAESVVLGCDCSEEYVTLNSDYTT
jgi:glutamate N-acetyltransferase/amino-acid N-acetyltransferase